MRAAIAAGSRLSKVTVLAGAFSVGIGFGLQSVVNNFASGLILLFERPIDKGDSIETGNLRGTVGHIGIRASVVRPSKWVTSSSAPGVISLWSQDQK